MILQDLDYITLTPKTINIETDVKNLLIQNDKEDTLLHVINVSRVNGELAEQLQLDKNKCIISGLLHDISAIIRPEDMLKYAIDNHFEICEAECKFPFLLHQRISRTISNEHFEIIDNDILSAIECHTTLKATPNKYEMALFIADIARDFSSRNKRRELARQYIKDGVIQGYLAYDGDKAVGWCNANTKSECLHCTSWLRFIQSVDVDDTNLKIKSIFCFVIAPDMRRHGIATKLLRCVCEDAKTDGFDVVESYPKKEFVSTTRDFLGPVEMYKNSGFTVVREVNDITVMRKVLK